MKNLIKANGDNTNAKKQKLKKLAITTGVALAYFGASICFAEGPNYAKNVADWIMGQLVWLGVIATAIAMLMCVVAKAWTRMMIAFLVGGMVTYIFGNPTVISEAGGKIWSVVNGG